LYWSRTVPGAAPKLSWKAYFGIMTSGGVVWIRPGGDDFRESS
jgi:hypothetical protein